MSEKFRIIQIETSVIDAERKRVLSMLCDLVPTVYLHEVGSTAVLGVIGKEDLDFLVLPSEAEFSKTRTALDANFERNPDQLSNNCYQGYIVESVMDVSIQLTVSDGPYDNFLNFQNRLKSDPELVEQYNQLKRNYDGQSMDSYRSAKRDFIEGVLDKTEK